MTVDQTLNELKEEEITRLVDSVSVSSNQKQALTVTLLYLGGERFPVPAVRPQSHDSFTQECSVRFELWPELIASLLM